jgi:protein SCO1
MAGKTAAAAMLLMAVATASIDSRQADRRYAVRGMVLRVDAPARTFFVSHERIDGLMDAMTMPFEVRDARELQGVQPGALVEFTLVIEKAAGYATTIRERRYESTEQDPQTARPPATPRRMAGRVPPPVAIGERVPDFTLTDSTRAPVSLSSFAGQIVVMNFVYTRCTLPQFCLRMSNSFSVLQKRFSTVLGRDVQLLTVTFDPERDTPEVLAAYAGRWGADARGWRFLTGAADDVRRTCALFGLDAVAGGGRTTHPVSTVLLGRDGRLLAKIEGNAFTPQQLGDLLRTLLEA